MRLFGKKVTVIVNHNFFENVEDFMQAVNKLAESGQQFQVRMVTNRDGQTLYEVVSETKIK